MNAPASPLGVGLHNAIPSDVYHADPCAAPSLSSGVARVLIEKTPAHAYLEHVRLGGHKIDPTPDMILGNYVHGLLSGDLLEFEVGNFDNYTTKSAKEWRDGTKLAGKTPILEKTADRAQLIAKALREKVATDISNNPLLLGQPEVTAIWQENDFWFRARYDRLVLDETGFADVWDWKTTGVGVSDDALLRIIIDKGYHVQAAHYLRGLRALAPRFTGRTSFIFAFVETEEPFAVRRVVLSEGFLQIGSTLLNRAIARWQHCLANNVWPDDSTGTRTIEPPAWYSMRVMEDAA